MAIDHDPNLPDRQDVQDNSAHMREGLERDGLQPKASQQMTGAPSDFEGDQINTGFHGLGPEDLGMQSPDPLMRGSGSFNRNGPTAMGGFAIPAGAGRPQQGRHAGWSGWTGGPAPFNVIDMEEHTHFTATIEEEFANYLTDFPPVYLENDEREEIVKKAIRMGVAMARNLREFTIAQMTEHLASAQHKHDPFFSHHRMPLLIPITETVAAEKALETIPFSEYYQRLSSCFPNFTTPVFMHLIVAFGPALKVGVPTVESMARQHYVILPDAKKLVDVLIKQFTHMAQVQPAGQRRV